MLRVLLALAVTTAIAAVSPAQGQSVAASGFSASSGFGDIRVVSPPIEIGPGHYLPVRSGRHHRDCRGDHCRHVRVDDDIALGGYGGGYGAGGYYDYGDYDANRSFSPDKWNDWWHERPDRAFPRWVWSNQNCSMDRMWYSGSGWRCTP